MSTDSHSCSSRVVRTLLAGLVVLTCLRVWIGPVQIVEKVYGQIPDAGTQRRQVLEEARQTNQLLAQIAETLKSHTFKVRVEGDDDKPGKTAVPGRGPVARSQER